jgi:hypothetical protein
LGESAGLPRGLLIVAIVVDEAAVGDDPALGVGQRADRALKFGDGAVGLHSIGGDVVVLLEDRLAETGDEDVIAQGFDLFGFALGDDLGAVYKVHAAVIELDQVNLLLNSL